MYTSSDLLDSIITEEYELFKALVAGNYAQFCAFFTDIMSKLAAMRKGLKEDQEAHDKCVEDLKSQLKRALTPEVEPGGAIIGGKTTEISFDQMEGK